ncbi:hypothetical protein NC651_035973 [Populus alba x Populus x berolinensis]|nr:hypothetical protein NC651_035973 [Populus alba x Populus x berolinensis]
MQASSFGFKTRPPEYLGRKMGVIDYLDTILAPLSLFLMVGYHVYLWHCFKNKPSQISEGIEALKRKTWFAQLKEGDTKTGMLAVQSLRNAQMATISTAAIAIIINLALAALTNNNYKASHLLSGSAFFGSQSGKLYVLKFGSASLSLLYLNEVSCWLLWAIGSYASPFLYWCGCLVRCR